MKDLLFFIGSSEITEAIGWTLFHSLWQGFIIAIFLTVSLVLARNSSAELRYYLASSALLLLLVSSSATFYKAHQYALEKQELKNSILYDPGYLTHLLNEEIPDDVLTAKKTTKGIDFKKVFIRSDIQKHFPWMVGIWLIGLSFYILRISGGLIYQQILKRKNRTSVEQIWHKKLRKLADKLNIKKKIGFYASKLIISPVTTGYVKPVILIPISLMSGLKPEQVEAIIAHELAHIKRNDYLINIFQILIETIFFFHPCVWYISAQIRKERENACDDIALSITSDKVSYAKALANSQEYALNHGRFALAFAPVRNTLLQRIKRLNKKITMKASLTEKLISGLLILLTFVLLSFNMEGNYNSFKTEPDPPEKVENANSASPLVAVVEKEVTTNEDGKKKTEKYVYKVKEENLDSLFESIELHELKARELEKAIEIALTETDTCLSGEIIRSIEIALNDLDVDLIVKESMAAAEQGMLEAREAMKNIQIEHIIDSVWSEEFGDSICINTHLIMEEAMESAMIALDSVDLDLIVSTAMDEALIELKELNISDIVSESLQDALIDIENERMHILEMKEHHELLSSEYEKAEKTLYEKEKELKAELERLEEELEKIKEEQKNKKKKKEDID